MIFGIFGRTKHHPLTDYCTKLSAPANLLKTASVRIADVLPGISKQHIVLSLILAAAAGDFVKNLRWEGSRRYLKSTNLDVITAEAIIWMYFLMVRFYLADQKRALIDDFAFPQALSDALFVIQDKTGFDFEKTGFKRWQRYCESVENREDVSLVFASIVLHSVGRQSLAEPMKDLGPVPLVLEWAPLSIQVTIFFSTMPSAYYETYKNLLREWPFPEDDRAIRKLKSLAEASTRQTTK
jgi:hypothetical protein